MEIPNKQTLCLKAAREDVAKTRCLGGEQTRGQGGRLGRGSGPNAGAPLALCCLGTRAICALAG